MPERVIKGGRAFEGDEFVVIPSATDSVDSPPDREIPPESNLPEGTPGQADPVSDDGAEYQLPSEKARSEAEKIRAEAEEMAQEIATQAEAEALARREKTEDELQQMMESTLKDLETQRESLERETRTRLEQEYRERYQQAIVSLEKSAADLQAKREEYLAQIEEPAMQLVLAIARRLLGAELSRSPRFVAELIGAAFHLLKPEGMVHVELHPATFHLLSEDTLLVNSLRESGINPDLVELAIDETLKPDAFRARVGGMSVDYDLDTVIDELVNHVEERAATEQAEGSGDGE